MHEDNEKIKEVLPYQSTDEDKRDSHDFSNEDNSCDSER